jgi:hypothetical protein
VQLLAASPVLTTNGGAERAVKPFAPNSRD